MKRLVSTLAIVCLARRSGRLRRRLPAQAQLRHQRLRHHLHQRRRHPGHPGRLPPLRADHLVASAPTSTANEQSPKGGSRTSSSNRSPAWSATPPPTRAARRWSSSRRRDSDHPPARWQTAVGITAASSPTRAAGAPRRSSTSPRPPACSCGSASPSSASATSSSTSASAPTPPTTRSPTSRNTPQVARRLRQRAAALGRSLRPRPRRAARPLRHDTTPPSCPPATSRLPVRRARANPAPCAASPKPFLTLPTSCAEPLPTSYRSLLLGTATATRRRLRRRHRPHPRRRRQPRSPSPAAANCRLRPLDRRRADQPSRREPDRPRLLASTSTTKA